MNKSRSINIKSILLIVGAVIFAALLGWYLGFNKKFGEPQVTESANTMMEKMQKVFKFVAAEGQISEIYDYKDYQYYDISPFRKKILVRVNAKVLVGYDFEKASIRVDELSQTIYIDSIGPAELLAIDHDLDYYDIQEGTFNYFSEEELNEINTKAKSYAAAIVEDSDLYKVAEEQKDDLIDMLRVMVQSTGWKIEVGDQGIKD